MSTSIINNMKTSCILLDKMITLLFQFQQLLLARDVTKFSVTRLIIYLAHPEIFRVLLKYSGRIRNFLKNVSRIQFPLKVSI